MERLSIKLYSILFVVVSLAFSAPVSFWYEKGNEFYEQKLYDSATVYYEKAIKSGIQNSTLYYNGGNAYFRSGNIGKAMLYYEKAKLTASKDPDIIANIKYAKLQLVDKIPEPKAGFLEVVFGFFHDMFSLETQLWVVFLFLALIALIVIMIKLIDESKRLLLIYIGSVCFLLLVFNGASIGKKIYDIETNQYAIVLDKTVDALNEPEGNKTLFTVHEGVKFQVLKFDRGWCFVSLANGVCGWVEQSVLGFI